MRFRSLVILAVLIAGSRGIAIASGQPAGGDSVGLISLAGVREVVAQHRGEVVVVNIWATWCLPCVEELPDLARLSRESGVRVIGISIDDPEDIPSRVVPFLKKHPIPFPVFVKADGSVEAFINGMHRDWSGAIPVTFIYDPRGRQRIMLTGKQPFERLRKEVDSMRGR